MVSNIISRILSSYHLFPGIFGDSHSKITDSSRKRLLPHKWYIIHPASMFLYINVIGQYRIVCVYIKAFFLCLTNQALLQDDIWGS